MPIGGMGSSVDYIIRVVFEKRGAMQAERSINTLAQKNLTAMQKIDSSTKETSRTYEGFTRSVKGIATPMMRLNQTFTDGEGKVTNSAKLYGLVGNKFVEMGKQANLTTQTIGHQATGIAGLAAGYAKLALRAVSVVPIWMIIRGVVSSVTKAVTGTVRAFIDLEREMGRVAGVTRGTEVDINRLKDTIIDFSRGASRGFKEAAQAMYALGSAGLNVREQMAGMEHIMNVAIGTFGNVEQIAKLVAGAYNVFGDSIEGVHTSSEKFKYISDVLSYTYSTQQVELSEIANAMTYVASIGSLLNISFTDLVATIGFLNTGMLKGSKSGTALMNAFVKLAVSGDKLADLGVAFDPSKPLDLMDIMTQLNNIYGGQALALTDLKDIMDVFGRRGGRAAAQMIKDFDRWKRTIGDTKVEFKDFAEKMKNDAESTLPMAFAKLGNAIKANVIDKLKEAAPLIEHWADTMAKGTERAALLAEFEGMAPPAMQVRRPYTEWEPPKPGGLKYRLSKFLRQPTEEVAPEVKAKLAKAIGPSLDVSAEWFKAQQQYLRVIQDIIAGYEVIKKTKEETLTFDKQLNDLATSISAGTLTEKEVREELEKIIKKSFGHLLKTDAQYQKFVEYAAEELKLKKEIAEVEGSLTMDQEKKIRAAQQTYTINLLQAQSVRDTSLSQVKMNFLIEEINRKVEKNKDYSGEILTLQDLINGDYEKLDEIMIHVAGTQDDILKLYKESYNYIVLIRKETEEYASTLKTAFSGIFKDVLLGEGEIGNVFLKMGDAMRDILAGAIADSFSEALLATGIGEAFGGMGAAFATMFQGPMGKLKGAIVDGAIKSAPILSRSLTTGAIAAGEILKNKIREGVTGAPPPPGGGGVGMPGAGGAFGPTGMFGAIMPFLRQPVGGVRPGMYSDVGTGTLYQKGGTPAPTYGQMFGGMTTAAMTGYSQYQSMQARGKDPMMSGISAGMMGMGSLWMTGGMMAGPAGVPAIALGAIMVVGGMLIDAFTDKGKQVETTVEERTQTKQVTSRIDVTNKQLELVNRNLLALKDEMTYIMQTSYYFRERNVEDRFAIDSQRGNM